MLAYEEHILIYNYIYCFSLFYSVKKYFLYCLVNIFLYHKIIKRKKKRIDKLFSFQLVWSGPVLFLVLLTLNISILLINYFAFSSSVSHPSTFFQQICFLYHFWFFSLFLISFHLFICFVSSLFFFLFCFFLCSFQRYLSDAFFFSFLNSFSFFICF